MEAPGCYRAAGKTGRELLDVKKLLKKLWESSWKLAKTFRETRMQYPRYYKDGRKAVWKLLGVKKLSPGRKAVWKPPDATKMAEKLYGSFSMDNKKLVDSKLDRNYILHATDGARVSSSCSVDSTSCDSSTIAAGDDALHHPFVYTCKYTTNVITHCTCIIIYCSQRFCFRGTI